MSKRGCLLTILLAVLLGTGAALRAKELPYSFSAEAFQHIRADRWSVVGKNIILEGNIHIPFNNMELYADKAVVNIDSHDLEAAGNIRLYRWVAKSAVISPRDLGKYERTSNLLVSVTGIVGDLWGKQSVQVDARSIADSITAHRVTGNLKSGYFRFDRMQIKTKGFVGRAESGERRANGVIELKNAEVSACEYLQCGNGHYSVGSHKVTLTPYEPELYGVKDVEGDIGEYDIFMTNGFVKVYGVPLMWLPVFYKPKDQSPGLFSVKFGKNSDWGYFVNVSRRFHFSDYPDSSMRVMADYYNLRGWGYGLDGEFITQTSRTEFFAYSIYDLRPGEGVDYSKYRLHVPHGRYNFRVSNLTHITPRLDFRGAFEYNSDYFFRRDFFAGRYASDPEPSTYAALEQQFDHFSASVYFRLRVNDFYTVVEKLPEVRIDVHRQEIFNTNIYHQAEFSASYNQMRWAELEDLDTMPAKSKLDNYSAFRADTTHFLYYPLRTKWFTLVPRAGMRMTFYSRSSDQEVSSTELIKLFTAVNPNLQGAVGDLTNYDKDGNAKFRVIGELGAEASTKIHNTWQNVRSSFLRIDGLRHVMRPYINYTYVSDPTVDRDNIYYFDDSDRIEKQNFMRFGVDNRLQTRDGDGVKDIVSMQCFWDYHFEKGDDVGDESLSRVGDFCTILKMELIRGLTLGTSFSIDAGGNNREEMETYRNGHSVGSTGLNLKWLNRWDVSLTYKPIEDVTFSFTYNYMRPYVSRSSYSMGSTLTQINGSGYFDRYFTSYSESFTLSGTLPLTPDRRTMGRWNVSYDFQRGHIQTIGFQVTRRFHCVELIAALAFDHNTSSEDSNVWDTSFSIQARLLGMEAPVRNVANQVLTSATDMANAPSSITGRPLW